MSALTLREARPADAALLVRLIHEAFEQYRGRLSPPSGAHMETASGVAARLEAGALRAVVATIDGEPAGCVFYEVASDHVVLSRLSVRPQERGRGVGCALVEAVEDDARAAGKTHVRLGVRVALADLRAWYERLGYHYHESRIHDGFNAPTYVILTRDVSAPRS